MNRKGFTLIEVVLVIVITTMLFLILVPNIMLLIDKQKVNSCNNMKDSIINAAKIYISENKYELNFIDKDDGSGNIKTVLIKVDDLVKAGDLKTNNDNKIINPKTNEELDLNTIINVEFNKNTKEFKYILDIDCK